MVSDAKGTVLVRNAEIHGRSGTDVRVGADRIEDLGLPRQAGEQVIDAAGGAVIPGLHDHHVHLRAAVAVRRSVDASTAADPAAFDQLISSAASAATTGWLRVTGWDEHRSGELDRHRLDRLAGALPVRVQHRSGAMWVLNSAALSAVGAERSDLAGIERDQDDRPTGRLLRLDGWLRSQLGPADNADRSAFRSDLAAYATLSARLGVTGCTDATPGRDQADADEFGALSDAGVFSQRLVLMAPPGLDPPGLGRVTVGPVKVILDDAALPSAAELASWIRDAHGHGRGAAVHCVTAEQLVAAVAACEQAGPAPAGTADRIGCHRARLHP